MVRLSATPRHGDILDFKILNVISEVLSKPLSLEEVNSLDHEDIEVLSFALPIPSDDLDCGLFARSLIAFHLLAALWIYITLIRLWNRR